jgi:mono/diheme cytochrome c family protein
MRTVLVVGAMAVAGLAGCVQEAPEVTGRADFQALCAGCHGAEATGGAGAADLTRIAARDGGRFDHARVMSHIDGYTRRGPDEVMPDFGVLLEGETVLVDLGDGVLTPTPARLFGIAQYLASIQQDEGAP